MTPHAYKSPQSAQGQNYAYGGFFNDPTAQIAFQVGGKATEAAGIYMEQNVCRLLPVQTGMGAKLSTERIVREIYPSQCVETVL